MKSSYKLAQIAENGKDHTKAINNSIKQIQDQIDDLQEQDDAIVEGMLDPIADDLTSYLNTTKLPIFKLIDSGSSVELGSNYNVVGYTNQLVDWKIIDSSGNTIYEYNGTGWDHDPVIVEFLDEWDFGNDYLTRPLSSGASYGIREFKNNLENVKSMLQENGVKVHISRTHFEKFAKKGKKRKGKRNK